jgi:hypothetical protein
MGRRPNQQDVIKSLLDEIRKANQSAADAEEHARIHRERRDVFIRRLYSTGLFSYAKLAKEINRVGCGAESVAKVVQNRANQNRAERAKQK